MSDLTVWVDGAFVDPDQPAISAVDHGVTVGDGIFETLRVHNRVPFALSRHLERLARSAAGLGLEKPDDALLRGAIGDALERSPLTDARLRISMTGGRGPLGSTRDDSPPTVIVVVGPLGDVAPTTAVVTVPWTRNDRSAVAGLKTTSYAENVIAVEHARALGAGEAIFPNTRDELCEGTASNVFVVIDGTLCTPPLASGCLAGITRALVLECAAGDGIAVYEASMPMSALSEASEVFVTGSVREVLPVTAVDGVPVAHAPGPVTERVQALYADLVRTTPDP